jgi:hypothetical protein
MEREKYLKSEIYYSDLYDRHTVERCRMLEGMVSEMDAEEAEFEDGEKISKETVIAVKGTLNKMRIHFETGERYLNKKNAIEEWMERDGKKDRLYESAEPPEDIRCLTCRNRLRVSSKMLWPNMDKEDRVLFMFKCPNKCLPHRAFFSDGEEYRSNPNLCPNCNIPLHGKTNEDEQKIVTTYTCSNCDYSKTSELDLTLAEEEKIDENFAVDRDRFCLTDETGDKYRHEKWQMDNMGKMVKEWEEEDKRRAEKLEANPKGFHLDGRGYTCFVCGQSTGEKGDNWYDQHGIKCLICQKAIDEGEVPATVASDKDSWYTQYDLEKAFGLKSRPLQKWIKEGIIKPRNISHYGNGIHYQLFLIEDNADFLPPKKLVESRQVRLKKEDGEIVTETFPWYQVVDDVYDHLKGYRIMDYLRLIHPDEEKEKKGKDSE